MKQETFPNKTDSAIQVIEERAKQGANILSNRRKSSKETKSIQRKL